jgi:hypothetical protein
MGRSCRSRWIVGLLLALSLGSSKGIAQTSSAGSVASAQVTSRVYGVSDTDVPTPIHSIKASSDTGAIQAVISFFSSAGISNWRGMSADGTITFGDDPQTFPAHLSVLGGDKCRLDVGRPNGFDSTILNGARAVFQAADGTHASISSDLSALGLFAFQRLLAAGYPTSSTLLSDQGSTSINGILLHRITLDDPSTDGTGLPWKTTDLYFAPATGRIVKSTAFVHLSPRDSALYMIATTYDDYREVGGGTLPYTYTQSLNGNLRWTLQLSSISLSTIPDTSLFQF